MPETSETAPFAETFAKPEALMRVPVGFASPLWGLFAGAAMGGSAWWWMTRWARAENLEAMFAAVTEAPAIAALPEPAPVEAFTEAVEAVEEAIAATEAVVEAPILEAPVGGEAAPIAPAVAAAERAPEPAAPELAAAPKPLRPKKADPKPE